MGGSYGPGPLGPRPVGGSAALRREADAVCGPAGAPQIG